MRNKQKRLLCFIIIMLLVNVSNAALAKESANNSLLSLNNSMLSILTQKRAEYKNKFLEKHPVIVALFSVDGGRFILYRPGTSPIELSLPESQNYRIAGIVEHSVMITYELVLAGQNTSDTASKTMLIKQMKEFKDQLQVAVVDLKKAGVSDEELELYNKLLTNAHTIIQKSIDNLISEQNPLNAEVYLSNNKADIERLTQIITSYQVTYWSGALAKWKKDIGKKWDDTYAVVEYIYVNPNNTILLQLLIKHMPKNSLGKKLFYFNTTSYSPTAEEALNLLVIKEPDSELANKIFGKGFRKFSSILPKTAIRALKKHQ